MADHSTPGTLAARDRCLHRPVALCVVVCFVIFAGGCFMSGHKGPTGLLGLKWGEDAADGAHRLGLTSDRWDPWIDPAFETTIDFDHPHPVLGVDGLVRLVRIVDTKLLDGVQVIYRGCAGDDAQKQLLRKQLHDELHVKTVDVDVPYETWHDHSLVHFVADPSDGTCTLTVAGPHFGKAFEAALLRGGLGNVGGAVGPK
jgi:hypothetical protein